MISHTDKLRGGPLAETEIYVAPATDEDLALSRLNQNFRLSKAQQILRLLKDQDDLNQRFRDCALLDDDAGAEGDRERRARRQREGDDEDRWSVEEEQLSDGGESDTSENEAERRAARRVALRKHRNSIDPGRCKTSMGFHNQAEVTDVPYDTDSDNVAGLDSACSTPRGGPGGPLSARQPASHSLYGPVMVGRGNTSVSSSNNARLRAFHLKIGDGDARNGDLSDECVVQSARSARPKTSLTSMATSSNSSSSSRHRYYRQQPHPESHYKSSPRGHNHHHGQHYHNHHHQNHQLHQQSRSVGETRQAIISRLDPHHPMAVRPFCETKTHAMEEVGTRGRGRGRPVLLPALHTQGRDARAGQRAQLHPHGGQAFRHGPLLNQGHGLALQLAQVRGVHWGSGNGPSEVFVLHGTSAPRHARHRPQPPLCRQLFPAPC